MQSPILLAARSQYANIRKLKDLPDQFLRELQDFFVNYHRLEGKEYKLLGCKGSDAAMTLIKKAQKAA
jgi:inorganic pyrophosphatase